MDRVFFATKSSWCRPQRPVEIRTRPASSIGLTLARIKCSIGLALIANGLKHLSSLHPTRQVGESALSVVTEHLADTPNSSFVRVLEGPRIYPSEALFLLAALAAAVAVIFWTLYALGVMPYGADDLIRLHLVDPLLGHHEIRSLGPS